MLNKVILIGRLVKEVETKTSNSNVVYANFTLAVNRPFNKNKENNCDFINCTAFNQSATYLKSFAEKGNLISVSGRLQVSNYKDSENKTKYSTSVTCEQVEILSQNKVDNSQVKNAGSTDIKFSDLVANADPLLPTDEDLPF